MRKSGGFYFFWGGGGGLEMSNPARKYPKTTTGPVGIFTED